jgi:hypothetical protein
MACSSYSFVINTKTIPYLSSVAVPSDLTLEVDTCEDKFTCLSGSGQTCEELGYDFEDIFFWNQVSSVLFKKSESDASVR